MTMANRKPHWTFHPVGWATLLWERGRGPRCGSWSFSGGCRVTGSDFWLAAGAGAAGSFSGVGGGGHWLHLHFLNYSRLLRHWGCKREKHSGRGNCLPTINTEVETNWGTENRWLMFSKSQVLYLVDLEVAGTPTLKLSYRELKRH